MNHEVPAFAKSVFVATQCMVLQTHKLYDVTVLVAFLAEASPSPTTHCRSSIERLLCCTTYCSATAYAQLLHLIIPQALPTLPSGIENVSMISRAARTRA